jgi:ABC-2 type transport system permease protein
VTHRALQVFAYELRRNIRRKAFLFTTFGVPVIGLIVLLVVQRVGAPSANTPGNSPFGPGINMPPIDLNGVRSAGYVDQTGMFSDPGSLANVLTLYHDEAAAVEALQSGEIDVYYLIPADYLQTGDVTVVMPKLNLTQINTDLIERLLLGGLASDVQNPQVFQRLVSPADIEEITLQEDAPQGVTRSQESSMAAVYAFAFTLLMSLFVTNGYLMQSVIEEKETRLIEILISTLRPIELLAGKIMALGLLGLLQVVVWIGGVFLIARVGGIDTAAGQALAVFANFYVPPALLPLMLVYFILAYILFAGAFAIVGALSNSMREGPQYAGLFTLPAVVPMYFLQLFVESPNGTIPTVLSLFPLTAPLAMVERLAVTTVPVWQIALSMALLALADVGMMWLAGRVFRVQTLLAGQLPRLRDLPRLVRG